MLWPALVAATGGGALAAWQKWAAPRRARKVVGYRRGAPFTLWVVPVGNGEYLEKRAAAQLGKLLEAAQKAGHRLSVTSGFRFHAEQVEIYQRYMAGKGNLAAKPGYSNHQEGLSADLGGVGGFNTAAYAWLKQNAQRYGFENDVPTEHWHWTYAAGKSQAA